LVDFFGEAGEDVAMVAFAEDEGMLVEELKVAGIITPSPESPSAESDRAFARPTASSAR
jgi:hypothetical protein